MPGGRVGDTFASFDLRRNPEMRPAHDRCVAVAEGREWCALLSGGYGNGKSHLAIAAMRAYGWDRSYFWKVPDFLAWLRERAFGDGPEKTPIDALLRSYREADFLLVLDDLGAENATDWAAEQLYRVLDSRYDAKLPTVITSNVAPDKIDARIRSRFRAGLVVCKGRDVRAVSA